MTLAAPAALWALMAIPLLVALYLLRVRRREHPVSSILLWQRSVPTLAAYRPTRRIERSLLLLLQILIAGALAVGLAQPVVMGPAVTGEDLFLVLDASLSMRARDVTPTRFERARAEAREMLAHLRPGQRAGIVLAAARPQLLVPLTADRDRLAAALAQAEPWDTAGDVAGAVTLAASQQSGGRTVVWTDAARSPLPAFPRVSYRILGSSDDNVGITALRVLRDPQGAEALIRVQNFSGGTRRVPLEVSRDATRLFQTALTLAPGESRTLLLPLASPGSAGTAGILRARLDVQDALPEDDVAAAVIDPTPLPSVLLVSPGNPYIEKVLRLLPVARAALARTLDSGAWQGFGVVILDRVDPGPLPPGNYLLIGIVPPNLPVSASGVLPRPGIATWDRADPVLRFVDLSEVRVDKALALAPEGGRVLIDGQVPLLWKYEGRGIRALLLGFNLQDSDLPLHVAFPILMANSLAWLGGGGSEVAAGDAIQVPAAGAGAADLIGPDGRRTRVGVADGMFILPPFSRLGLYRLATPAGERVFAAGIGSPRAGLIRPGQAPSGAMPVSTSPAPSGGRPEIPQALLARIPLWPWLLFAAIAAAIGEWALATRRSGGEA